MIKRNSDGSGHYLHKMYSEPVNLTQVINNIDIELLKTLLKLDISLLTRETRYAGTSRLSNIIDLFDNQDLVKNISDSLKIKRCLQCK